MAFLIISAADPCKGALIAALSAACLLKPFAALISLRYKRLPIMVSTNISSLAWAFVLAM